MFSRPSLAKLVKSVIGTGSCKIKQFGSSTTNPDFTKNAYDVKRGNFKEVAEEDVAFFRELLGEERVVTDFSDLEKYNVDWFRQYRGGSRVALKPKTTNEVASILSFCNNQRLAVCPQGGNTSVVGSSVPIFDEVVVTTELMNKIISLDETSGILVCESGCVLETLNSHVGEKGLIMPLDLGAKGSCQIGGNVSTNAGGLRLMRYGNLHGNVLGLEVVKASGEIVDCLSTLKKDNTGYHLKHLFIGSEGTLGFITKVAIQCPPKPKSINLAFLGLQSFDKVLETYKQAKQDLGEIISAMEVMDSTAVNTVQRNLGLKKPIEDYPFYMIVETSGSNEEHDAEKLHNFLEYVLDKRLVLNGTVATDQTKVEEIWSIRERISEAFKMEPYEFCYDFTLPLEKYYQLVLDMREYMGSKALQVYGFGHLGDGNLHLQIGVTAYSKELKSVIEPYVFHKVASYRGSISAEHGMGFQKAVHLDIVKQPEAIGLMRSLKKLIDPNGILNPYKVLPPVQ